MTAIIVLNWNGAEDTIRCLESLQKAEGDFVIIVADNGSTDGSVEKISQWCNDNCLTGDKIHVLKMEENLGFARGNNKALAFAKTLNPDSYLLLNNDTAVLPDFLIKLTDFSKNNPEYRVLTPKICYFDDKNRIWNCGGKMMTMGRRYYYAKALESDIKEKERIDITFVTGCALFFYPELLDNDGRIFTERFFFGEEDFDFSLRMKELKVPMACVLDSKIYHKVSATAHNMSNVGKLHIHYLNRTINIRQHYSKAFFMFWKTVNFPLMLKYFYQSTESVTKSISIIRAIYKEAGLADGVSKERFLELVKQQTGDKQ